MAVSVHPEKQLALSFSRRDCFLWDTDSWKIVKKLEGDSHARFLQANFSPDGQYITTAFEDASLCIWESDTFNLKWKLSRDRAPDTHAALLLHTKGCHACNLDGSLFAVSGPGGSLLVWDLFERRFLHEIHIGQFGKDASIKQLGFLGSTNIAAVLSDGGNLVFVDMIKSKQVGQLDSSSHLVCPRFPCVTHTLFAVQLFLAVLGRQVHLCHIQG